MRIASFGVTGLFGSLSYKNIHFGDGPEVSRIGVIFGDNGAGKTTLLHLLYAAVSSQEKAGLRTFIARTPFENFSIRFSDGLTISIDKTGGKIGSYQYTTNGHPQDVNLHIVADTEGAVKDQPSVVALDEFLKALDLDVLFVDHERYVRSTYAFLQDAYYAEEPNYFLIAGTASASSTRDSRRRDKSLQFPLMGMLEAVNAVFRRQAFQQGSEGDVNASSVYLEIVRAITRKKKPGPSPQESVPFEEQLESLERETETYVNHGLLSDYPFRDILNLHSQTSTPKRNRIAEALSPFIASIRRRVSALADVHDLMMNFETEINRYLSGKVASVHALHGLVIKDSNGKLNVSDLSSGEKQLFFLLSSAVVSRGARSLILIDEPELSLNYKWQRAIAASLETLSSSHSTQFVMASHSIEIISRLGENAYELENDTPKADA